MSAYLLIISTQAPYHSSAAIDAFEAALAASNVGLQVKILLEDDGVYQCVDSQQAESISHKNTYKKLCSLPLFDIEDIYVNQASIDIRELRITNTGKFSYSIINQNDVLLLKRASQQILVF